MQGTHCHRRRWTWGSSMGPQISHCSLLHAHLCYPSENCNWGLHPTSPTSRLWRKGMPQGCRVAWLFPVLLWEFTVQSPCWQEGRWSRYVMGTAPSHGQQEKVLSWAHSAGRFHCTWVIYPQSGGIFVLEKEHKAALMLPRTQHMPFINHVPFVQAIPSIPLCSAVVSQAFLFLSHQSLPSMCLMYTY